MRFFIAGMVIISVVVFIAACNGNNASDDQDDDKASIPVINYRVVKSYRHDTTLFTEGLTFYKGTLYESGGAPPELPFTKSVIGHTDLLTGTFTPKIEIDKSRYFGEGITFLDDKLYQLTYKNQQGFIYDANTFKKVGAFAYKNPEGWGLTTDGKHIIMSDGSADLTYLNPERLQPDKVLNVTENGMPRDSLNELEYIKGYIYANIWMRPEIIKINPQSGAVVGRLNLSALVQEVGFRKVNADVLNGIAYDSATGKVYVTGKLWPYVYEIAFEQ